MNPIITSPQCICKISMFDKIVYVHNDFCMFTNVKTCFCIMILYVIVKDWDCQDPVRVGKQSSVF